MDDEVEEPSLTLPTSEVEAALAALPRVRLRHDAVPEALSAASFLETIVMHVLQTTPVNYHREARRRIGGLPNS